MRTLRFIVDKQIIDFDSTCDFEDIVPGTEGYLQAEFIFSPEWDGFVKVAGFIAGNVEQEPRILKDGKTCMIPSSALKGNSFKTWIVGKKGNCKLITNMILIHQNGG